MGGARCAAARRRHGKKKCDKSSLLCIGHANTWLLKAVVMVRRESQESCVLLVRFQIEYGPAPTANLPPLRSSESYFGLQIALEMRDCKQIN